MRTTTVSYHEAAVYLAALARVMSERNVSAKEAASGQFEADMVRSILDAGVEEDRAYDLVTLTPGQTISFVKKETRNA